MRVAKEASLRDQIRSGASLFELLNIRDMLAAAGTTVVDGTWNAMAADDVSRM